MTKDELVRKSGTARAFGDSLTVVLLEDAINAINAERERCALICDYLAKYEEGSAGCQSDEERRGAEIAALHIRTLWAFYEDLNEQKIAEAVERLALKRGYDLGKAEQQRRAANG